MNNGPSRRTVAIGLTAFSASVVPIARAANSAQIVIIGGGFGGASAAMMLRKVAPHIGITLIEAQSSYVACPFSNLVLAGTRKISKQTFAYSGLEKAGITVVQGYAEHVDPAEKSVRLTDGVEFPYDRLVLSPGIDLKWGEIEGYDQAAADSMPHAWKAGPQTTLLRAQLAAMKDGGTVVMAIPPAPFRCPPGPYERASLIAHYLKTHKPRSKLRLLDAQDRFSKQALFEEAWAAQYADIVERMPGSESGRVIRVDPSTRTLHTDFDAVKADVANVIPPQKAGRIAEVAGVTDASGWCPIHALTFESRLQPNIHVIGDATIAAPMPKSAFSANLQGKICAVQIARLLAGKPPVATTLSNTCYSFANPDTAFSVSGVYHNKDDIFQSVAGAGGTSPTGEYAGLRAAEAAQARDWFAAITREAFG